MFEELLQSVKTQAVNLIFKVSFIQQPQKVNIQEGRDNSLSSSGSNQSGGEIEEKSVPVSNEHNIGRNDPCWCNSGKKYKKCHGK